jgi:MFS family permease
MVILDATIAIVALPSIGSALHFAPQDLQWVLSAYALTYGGLLLLGGRAADLLGRRRVFMAGVLLFSASSLGCGVAWSPAALITARALQGLGAAIMTPTALSIIATTFTDAAERNKALGIWGALGGIGATAAWLIGGPLVSGPAGGGSSSSTSPSASPRSRCHQCCSARVGRRWRGEASIPPVRSRSPVRSCCWSTPPSRHPSTGGVTRGRSSCSPARRC